MEEKLVFMKAYLDRFNVIYVHVSKNYYQGKCQKFHLKNLTTGEIFPTRIVYDFEDEKANVHIYQLMVNNIRLSYHFVILNNYGLTCEVETRHIVNDPMFDHIYYYGQDDLGADYQPEETTFKVWSPTSYSVLLEYVLVGEKAVIVMKRGRSGVFSATVKGDLEGAEYLYIACNGNTNYRALDPYAYASSANGEKSIVVDPNKFIRSIKAKSPFKRKSDAIIYEVSVRDFTSAPTLKCRHKSQFLGVVEEKLKTSSNKPAGFDYLKKLGITHIQLMPIFDFATVEETCPTLLYNWGYDPSQFNVPEGSYCSDVHDPYSRINECIVMINKIHQAGIRVTMDMVINHVYDVNSSSFERLVPHYFFRNDDYGNISNGSYCSNDINSECAMVRKYILDICKRWQTIYGVDGFRFDLMGILDIETINQVEKQASLIDPLSIVYGEGWNMNTMLPDDRKAMISNHSRMPNISFFNDEFRDVLKGASFSKNYHELGYLTGNSQLANNACRVIKNADKFTFPVQSINYVECHDNATLYDYLNENLDEDRTTRLKRQKILNTAVILSQGIPLLHCGQEFCRTKKGISNSYNSPDSINLVDWELKDKMIDQVQYVKNLIKLRQNNLGFRYMTKQEIEKNVDVYYLDHQIMVYCVKQTEGEYKQVKVIFNPTKESTYYSLGDGENLIISTETSVKLEFASLLIEPISVYIIAGQ